MQITIFYDPKYTSGELYQFAGLRIYENKNFIDYESISQQFIGTNFFIDKSQENNSLHTLMKNIGIDIDSDDIYWELDSI